MKVQIGLRMRVEASRPGEGERVEALNREIDELAEDAESVTEHELDDSLSQDFLDLLRDLRQLMARASARRPRRGEEGGGDGHV